uniref:Ovule protein n=1 Tax=Heterorhabditis bacteriophora TaxID=37862 RepID=A0A1I7W8K5_HETBA
MLPKDQSSTFKTSKPISASSMGENTFTEYRSYLFACFSSILPLLELVENTVSNMQFFVAHLIRTAL